MSISTSSEHQIIRSEGVPVAVVVPYDDYLRMTAKDDYRYVLSEAVGNIIEKAKAVGSGSDYDAGRKMAYFEILQAIQDVADEIGVGKEEIGLADFDHGSLVGLRKTA